MTIEVIEPGFLSSVQDPPGRSAWRHLGVPQGGALDPWSARLANRLVGNPDDAAVLEMTLRGPTLRFAEPSVIALTGQLGAALDGLPFPTATPRAVRAGSVLRVEAGVGARAWLAVAGGVDVPQVLGSRATDLRAGFGGHQGRKLRTGDRLPVGRDRGRPHRWVGRTVDADGPIRIVATPSAAELAAALTHHRFAVGAEADRAGVRLDGPELDGRETASLGLPLGAVQVPPDGRPIVMLVDRPVTGGYVVPAVVITADLGRVAQLRAGDEVSFRLVDLGEARAAWRGVEKGLAAVEPLDAAPGDELGWAGSHG